MTLPHQCLNCGETFREGSVEILEGCPECDGTRFFHTEEGLDADEREDLREETQETVKEAIEEALQDPDYDSDVWSWERREEWLRLEPDEAREILHDVVDDAEAADEGSALPTVADLAEEAPDPDDGTRLAFPDAPGSPGEAPDGGPVTGDAAPEPPREAEPDPGPATEAADTDGEPGPDADGDRVTPAELANELRPDDEVREETAPEEPAPDARSGGRPGPEAPTEEEPETVSPEDGTGSDPPTDPEPELEAAPTPDEGPEPSLEPAPTGDRGDEAPAPEATPPGDGSGEGGDQVSTVNVEEPGRYDIDVESLLDTNPVIIEKDGHYMVHLPSIFSSFDEDEARR